MCRRASSLLVLFILLLSVFARSTQAQTRFTARQLAEDFAIAKKAFLSLHPGLYRYASRGEVERRFDELERSLGRDLSLAETYLAFSRFTASIRCGHTYCNFWNQSDAVKRELFNQADKLPFTFVLIDRRMIVTRNVSAEKRLDGPIEILEIDAKPVNQILGRLLPFVKGDGSNDAKRLADLELSGLGEHEAFDVFHPLVFPPKKGVFRIKARNLKTRATFSVTVRATSRDERFSRLQDRFGPQVTSADELWTFSLLKRDTALLRLGTFATWEMKMDWKAFLHDAFAQARTAKTRSLIVDIRGNEGGADDVLLELARYLLWKPARLPAKRTLLRYEKVSADLLPYLTTWDASFKDRSGQVEPAADGFYRFKGDSPTDTELPASDEAFQGKIYLLIGAANSSATFTLASILQRNQIATLVGQPTGGNRRGITGGQIFFLTLPNSGIEMDIPLLAGFPVTDEPDEGIHPDVPVKRSVEDALKGVDAELAETLRLIERDAHATTP